MPKHFEQTHMGRVKAMPCRTCGDKPVEVHHVLEQGKRIGNNTVIPLCVPCHRGERGVHGDKSMLRITKKTELQLANEVNEELYP